MNATTIPPVSRERFFIIAVLVFVGSVLATHALQASMRTMTDLPMPGGWTLSTTFTPMCGRTWLRAAASFLGMWIAMMTAMMLPSFAPFLWRYRMTGRSARMTAGYFFIWTLTGCAVFLLGALFTAIVLRIPSLSRCVPVANGTLVLLAGAWQFSTWHARLLVCCQHGIVRPDARRDAWRDGVRHGLHCAACCAGLTVALIVVGMMNPYAMALATLAMTAERLAPEPGRVTRCIGVALVALGCVLIVARISA